MERRRKTVKGSSESMQLLCRDDAPIDTDDRFHEIMRAFVDARQEDVSEIEQSCLGAFQAYKDLALFLDDPASVYPPPRSESDKQTDLIALLHRLAASVRSHHQDVVRDKLRECVQRELPAATAAGAGDEVPAAEA